MYTFTGFSIPWIISNLEKRKQEKKKKRNKEKKKQRKKEKKKQRKKEEKKEKRKREQEKTRKNKKQNNMQVRDTIGWVCLKRCYTRKDNYKINKQKKEK